MNLSASWSDEWLVAKQEAHMSTGPTPHSEARFPSRAKFILVNDRVPRTDAYCAMCCEPIEQGYVREAQTRLLYCDPRCFAGHEKLSILSLERRARQVS
jgi:hypothetical protein